MRVITIMLLVLLSNLASHAEDQDSHRSAASELLLLMDMDEIMSGMVPTMTDAMVSSNPILQPYTGVLRDWATKTMTWKNFEGRFVNAYVDAFSESELREMIAFYQTPTGKKAIRLQPELMQKGIQFGNEVATEHQGELTKMLEERKAEIDALNSKSSE